MRIWNIQHKYCNYTQAKEKEHSKQLMKHLNTIKETNTLCKERTTGVFLTSSVTMIGQREVRCCGDILNRRTRNMRNIWADTDGVCPTRRFSVRRSRIYLMKKVFAWKCSYATLQVSYICFPHRLSDTLNERQIEVVLVILSAKHGKSLSFQ